MSATRASYAAADYWNQRYASTHELFDWYLDYQGLAPFITAAVASAPASTSVLHIGCGNSKLPEQMFDAGFKDVVHGDVSDVIVERMRERYDGTSREGIVFQVMDATRLALDDASVDLVIEKGTLDALVCDDEAATSEKIVSECYRVLRPGGALLLVTHGAPDKRLPLLEAHDRKWDVSVQQAPLSHASLVIRAIREQLAGQPMAKATSAVKLKAVQRVRALLQQAQECGPGPDTHCYVYTCKIPIP